MSVPGPAEHAAGTQRALDRRALGGRLLILFLVRTVLSAPFRVVYPFLPSIARGLGISVAGAGRLASLRVVGSIGAPLLGPLADRYGRRRMMEVGLLVFALAGLLLAGAGTLLAGAVAFALYGISKGLVDPAMHAYLGDTLPYCERGRAVGTVGWLWQWQSIALHAGVGAFCALAAALLLARGMTEIGS